MLQEKQKPKPADGSAVKRIQEIAAAENERKRKEEEEKKKKKGSVATDPSQGILFRMYEYFVPKEKK